MSDNKMKIGHITMFYKPLGGGQETYIENLNRIFRENNIIPEVVQPAYKKSKEFAGDNVHMLPITSKFDSFMVDSMWFLFNLGLFFYRRKLRTFDLLISHYPFHYPAIKWHKNVLVLSHGLDWHQPPKTLADRFRVYAASLCKKGKIIIVANDTHFIRKLGINVVPGERFFQEVEENVWFIPNCVDTDQFKPDTDAQREDIILVPRNIRKERGIHLAIMAFSSFSQKNKNYKLQVAGSVADKDYFKYCQSLVERYCLQDKIVFSGSISWTKMKDCYRRARITLIPTIEMEGTSLSALESMACKTPVVSTGAGGLADLPTAKAEADSLSISAKIEEVLNDWERYSNLQYNDTKTTFNLKNWERAWLTVVRG